MYKFELKVIQTKQTENCFSANHAQSVYYGKIINYFNSIDNDSYQI